MTAARKRTHAPNFAKEIAAIVRAGLLPRIISRPDGSVELTGLPPDKVVSTDHEAEDLGRKIDAMGAGGGNGD